MKSKTNDICPYPKNERSSEINQNTEVIPGSPLYQHKSKYKYQEDLKLISSMCLQGMLNTFDLLTYEQRAKYAIAQAKELLKQLETCKISDDDEEIAKKF